MKRSAKIWLWAALVLSVCTTSLNGMEDRWLSVVIAVISLAGLCLLLFREKKAGFYLMCGSNVLSFLVGAVGGIQGGTGVILSVVMSLTGAALIPAVTYFFIRSCWTDLK